MGFMTFFSKKPSKEELEEMRRQAIRNEVISHCIVEMEGVLTQYLETALTQRIIDEVRQRLV